MTSEMWNHKARYTVPCNTFSLYGVFFWSLTALYFRIFLRISSFAFKERKIHCGLGATGRSEYDDKVLILGEFFL